MKKYQLRVSLHEVGEDGSIMEKPSLEMRKRDYISKLNADELPSALHILYGHFDFTGWQDTLKEETTQGNKYEYDYFRYQFSNNSEMILKMNLLGEQGWHIYKQFTEDHNTTFWAARKLNN